MEPTSAISANERYSVHTDVEHPFFRAAPLPSPVAAALPPRYTPSIYSSNSLNVPNVNPKFIINTAQDKKEREVLDALKREAYKSQYINNCPQPLCIVSGSVPGVMTSRAGASAPGAPPSYETPNRSTFKVAASTPVEVVKSRTSSPSPNAIMRTPSPGPNVLMRSLSPGPNVIMRTRSGSGGSTGSQISHGSTASQVSHGTRASHRTTRTHTSYTDSSGGFSASSSSLPSAPRMRRGSSSGASAESDLQALNAPRHPSPTPSAAPSARRDGFMDVSEVTACKAGHDTKLTRWKLAACIAFPPTLIYHLAKTTRKCNRCGLLVPKRPSGPAATPFLVDM